MINKLKKLFWKAEGMEFSDNPENIKGKFILLYEKIHIGTLSYEKSIWTFQYSEEFKNNNEIEPISDFPDKNKIYSSEELWPFFAVRIPVLNQPYQFKKIERAGIDKDNSVELLKLFGNKTITNPFVLEPD